ncbi:MAG: nucleoside phosphorylase [Rhodospirillales bacterium]|nr:nucleoside phosphorylase [Rhodospirillales bacterium]
MVRAGFVTGLAVEAGVLRRHAASHDPAIALMIACAGADALRARQLAEDLLEAGAGALVSFGIAGGLDPALTPGDTVLPEAVVALDGMAVATDAAWRRRVLDLAAAKGLRPTGGRLVGSDQVVATVAGKRALFETSRAVAVDMESHAVALAAQAAGVPFLVVRAVIDPADRALPKAVHGSIAPDGRARKGLVTTRLVLRPWEAPQVNRLRQDTGAALRALGKLTRAIGPVLTTYPRGP